MPSLLTDIPLSQETNDTVIGNSIDRYRYGIDSEPTRTKLERPEKVQGYGD
ncbi:hypothetical protein ACTHRH_15295 [Paenibacillus sp. SAFN-117]